MRKIKVCGDILVSESFKELSRSIRQEIVAMQVVTSHCPHEIVGAAIALATHLALIQSASVNAGGTGRVMRLRMEPSIAALSIARADFFS